MRRKPRLIVIGTSCGGLQALKTLLGELPADFPLPLVIVQHISPEAGDDMARLLDQMCAIRIKEADEQETIAAATAYLAPPNYHLLIENDGVLSLSAEPHVGFARPSIDVLFESAAEAFAADVIGVVLTGANADGARGLRRIKAAGGLSVVQDPADAVAAQMPAAALAAVEPDYVLPLGEVARTLCALAGVEARASNG